MTLPGWASHWPAKALRQRHLSIGDRAFMQGYRMKAYADSDYVLPNFAKALELGKSERVPEGVVPNNWITFMGVDLAGKVRPGNALFCGAMETSTGITRPLEARLIKASSPKVANAIGDLNNRWHCQAIMVENNAYQGALIEWIEDSKEKFPWWQNIIPFTTGSNKADPILGVPGMDVEFSNGGWRIPGDLNPEVNGHNIGCSCASCLWVSQMQNYPHSAQVDLVMACWFFRECCRRWRNEQMEEDDTVFQLPSRPGVFTIPYSEIG